MTTTSSPHLANPGTPTPAATPVLTDEQLLAGPPGEMLKWGTRSQHEAAERHGFHAMLFGAAGPAAARHAYARFLGQHLRMQEVFEPALVEAARSHRAIAAMLQPYHLHLAAARADAALFGAERDEPSAATQRYGALIRQCTGHDSLPASAGLVGVWYVIEGATNGGTIIAKRVRDVLGLPDERGTRYINPHGPEVRPRWTAWKHALDAHPWSIAERTAMLSAARTTFRLSEAMMSELG